MKIIAGANMGLQISRLMVAAMMFGASVAYARVDVNVGIAVAPPVAPVQGAPAPYPGYVWAPGYWQWTGVQYVWVQGRWLPARPGYYWAPERWAVRGGQYYFVPGRWAVRERRGERFEHDHGHRH
jgi:hypothetical protein